MDIEFTVKVTDDHHPDHRVWPFTEPGDLDGWHRLITHFTFSNGQQFKDHIHYQGPKIIALSDDAKELDRYQQFQKLWRMMGTVVLNKLTKGEDV